MTTALVLVCQFALSAPASCAPEWTYSFDAPGRAELSGWRPWSFPAQSEVVQRTQGEAVELTSSGRAFALHRDLGLSGARGYTVAFRSRVTATGPPEILRCQAYLDWRVEEKTRFRAVRWQVYSLLTHGAKGLWYFTYPGGWGNVGLVDQEGKPTYLYGFARAINQEIRSMEPTLVKLRSTHLGHVGRPTPFATMFHPAPNELVTAAEAENALIGLFVGPEGTDYAMVMNKNHGPDVEADETQTAVLHLAAGIQKVTPVGEPASSSEWTFEAEARALKCEVPAGTGCLFRIE